ncbi:MAG TPA: glycosyltransferase [Prolixibacteraceae bacterium]|nr:glycosyltransferase [Prolixibacteraceae bacterium]
MEKYSIVIPVYKSSESLKILASQILQLEKEKKAAFEIIFVNDSPFWEETVEALREVSDAHPNCRVLTLRKNQGQHIALLAGISHATGKYVITMDDDLQHPVSEIPKLIAAMDKDQQLDALFALPPYKQKKHKLWRNLSSYMMNRIDTLFLKKPKGLMKSAFRIMTLDVAQTIVKNRNAMPSVSSLIIHTTHNIGNIEVSHAERGFGKSNYSLTKMIHLALNNMIHYSSLPLKWVGFIGGLGFGFSLVYILITIIRKLFWGIHFPGYASTVTLISFFGGLNLLALGIIGEYLIRIIKEQQKPDLENLIRDKRNIES